MRFHILLHIRKDILWQKGIQSQTVNNSPSSTNTQTGLNNITNGDSATGSGSSPLDQKVTGGQTVSESQNVNGSAGSSNNQVATNTILNGASGNISGQQNIEGTSQQISLNGEVNNSTGSTNDQGVKTDFSDQGANSISNAATGFIPEPLTQNITKGVQTINENQKTTNSGSLNLQNGQNTLSNNDVGTPSPSEGSSVVNQILFPTRQTIFEDQSTNNASVSSSSGQSGGNSLTNSRWWRPSAVWDDLARCTNCSQRL